MATDSTGSPDDTPADEATHIGQEETFNDLIRANSKILIDFYADWCGPCQLMAPTVDEIATEVDAPVVKIDVDELPQVATRFDVNSIPTFIVFEDGDVKERIIGMTEKAALTSAIE